MIRLATKQDIPAMLAVYAPYVQNTTFTFEYTVPTEAEFLRRFEEVTEQFLWIVWEEDGRVLGYAYGSAPFTRHAYRWCGEISIYLAEEIHGKGIGRQMYDLLEKCLFAQGYQIIYTIITSGNPGSVAFHKAIGYTLTCTMPDCGVKFGQRLGTIWMEKSRKSEVPPTVFPCPWTDVVQCDGKKFDILLNFTLS